ncbi:c-type cytochrome [Bacillus sp. NP157]|nr:c-type cytochrome [Bacillus sp. NP157]
MKIRYLVALAATLPFVVIAARAADLTVCVDRASPLAHADVGVAQAVGAHDHARAKIHYFDGSGDDDGFDLKEFNALAKSSCDLVLGFPVDADAPGVPEGLKATQAYGHTGFLLVLPAADKATSLASVGKGTRIAVTYQTTPNLYFADHPGLVADVHLTDDDGLKALADGKVGAAMVWGPTVAGFLKKQAGRFRTVELTEPHARFDLVALYDDAHAAAARQFESAVAALRADGSMARLLAPVAMAASARPDRRNALWRRPGEPTGLACAAAKKDTAAAPALYTTAQADSGATKYSDNCAQCHGPTLEGRAGPALKGPHFANPQANFHVGDIFTIVSQNMPATQPASLPQDDYVEIMAFLLRENGYPPGSTKLTFDEAKQSKVPLTSNAH